MTVDHLPSWALDALPTLLHAGKIILVVVGAWLLKRLIWRIVERLGQAYNLPARMLVPLRTMAGWIIVLVATLMVMQQLGVSAAVIWSAFTGFAAVAAVAFFAAWSVLSNLFCSFLLFTSAPFRVGDRLEILDASDKPGVKGRVLEIRLLYTVLQDLTAEDTRGARLQIPNSAFFQKTIRRWPPEADEAEQFQWASVSGF
ncbi:mechanosensitive ion channel family protein [Lampropedia puyangensis]|uniref:Small-conductance mechanosensitive channel n=1 Tax=Lampropedia puyangensis TaxID=1330072 RepID=A0A4S8FI04_9BURK|nr:mechanosensitive ion channel family protein [Lampropedia puyangensis]THU05332.1 mechanosensitive ion channel family protein [Lampropedia puyangensis]